MKNGLKKLKTQYLSLSVPVRAALWYTICNFLNKGVSVLCTPIFTRLMSTEEYGVYTVYQSWYSVIVIFATMNLYYDAFNNGMVRYPEDRDRFTSAMQGLTTTLTLGVCGVLLLFRPLWNDIVGLSGLLLAAMVVELLFAPAHSFWNARQRYDFRYRRLVAVTMFTTMGGPILGVIAVLLARDKGAARVLAFVAVHAAVGLVFFIRNFWKGRTFYDRKYWKFGLAFNVPLIPHYLSQSVLHHSDRLMIRAIIGIGTAAIYNVAYSVSTLMILVTSAINHSMVPYTYQCLQKGSYAKLKKMASPILVLVGIGVIFVIAFGPEVITVFAPRQYHDAIWIIPPVAASVYFMFMYRMFGSVEFFYGENKFVMIASIGAALANVVLNAIFIPMFGFVAAGYTTLFCYMLLSGGHYAFMRKVITKYDLPREIYDYRFFGLYSLLILAVMVGVTFLYWLPLVRYGLIAVMLVALFLRRKVIIRIVRDLLKGKKEGKAAPETGDAPQETPGG